MDFDKVLSKRTSIRAYKDKAIEDSTLKAIINNTLSAPSAGNLQAYKIYIVKNKTKLNQLSEAAWGQSFISEASLAFIFCALPEESGKKYGNRGQQLYSIQDATIAAAYCQLAATNLGLATVWVGAYNDNQVKKTLKLKETEKPVAIIPIGFANETEHKTPRKPIETMIEMIN